MSSITLIQNPVFAIDFSEYHAARKDNTESLYQIKKIQKAISFSLESVSYFFNALSKSLYEEVKFMGTSFKFIVLDKSGLLNGTSSSEHKIILAVLYTGVWILGMGFNITMTTGRLWFQHFFPKKPENEVKNYIDHEMNIDHITTDDFALNSSGVPATIKVDLLANIFEEINFDNPNAPGYMPPSTRKEYGTTYTTAELTSSLKTFIENVKTRTPFLGTPASYDIPRLMAFYQQIEDAVRLSIQDIEQKIEYFQVENGMLPSKYNPAQLNEYKGLLEDRARIAIDLAIAGKHCGARYMGEAMSVYYSTVGDQSSNDKTLEKTLIEILAKKRNEIALEHIQKHLGNDTHSYANYMGTLGQALAIPGTKNIIEQLAHPLDTDKFKRLFFDAYTIDTIIETVQDQIKSSNSFREKVIDWLKEQANSWNDLSQEEINNLKGSMVDQINAVIKHAEMEDFKDSSTPSLENLQELLENLKTNKRSIPSLDEGWDVFIENLLALSEVKIWCNQQLPNENSQLSPIENLQKRHAFKAACLQAKLGTELVEKLAKEIKEKSSFDKEHLEGSKSLQKVDKIRTIFNAQKLPSPSDETIQRIIFSKTTAQEVVAGILDSVRKSNFINALNLDDMATEGLSPELMEWILVSQKILLPQNKIIAKKTTLDSQESLFISAVVKHFKTSLLQKPSIENWIKSLKIASSEEIENEAENILTTLSEALSKRYRFETSHREKLLKIIFTNSYKNSSLEIVKTLPFSLLDKELPSLQSKNLSQISLSRISGNIIGSYIFKTAASIFAIAITLFAGYHMRNAIMNQVATSSKKTAVETALGIFLAERSIAAAFNTWKSCNYIAEYCKITANEFESEFLKSFREKVFPIWMGAMI